MSINKWRHISYTVIKLALSLSSKIQCVYTVAVILVPYMKISIECIGPCLRLQSGISSIRAPTLKQQCVPISIESKKENKQRRKHLLTMNTANEAKLIHACVEFFDVLQKYFRKRIKFQGKRSQSKRVDFMLINVHSQSFFHVGTQIHVS